MGGTSKERRTRILAKVDEEGKQGEESRKERLEKIRALIAGNGEDAAKVLKMWMDKEADAKPRR